MVDADSASSRVKAVDAGDKMCPPADISKGSDCLSSTVSDDDYTLVTNEEESEKGVVPGVLSPCVRETATVDSPFEQAQEIVAERFEGSAFDYRLDSGALSQVPRINMNELALGKRLGKGSFSNVDEIRSIMLNRSLVPKGGPSMLSGSSMFTASTTTIPSSHSTPPSLDRPVFPGPPSKNMAAALPAALKRIPRPSLGVKRQDTLASGNQESRAFMEQHCFRKNGETRYAIMDLAMSWLEVCLRA